MKILKKITALFLSALILTSFLLANVAAVGYDGVFPNDPNPQTFVAPSTKYYFSDGRSFCLTKITDFGQNDSSTDLEAATQGYNYHYADNSGIDTIVYVYAQATLYFSDGTSDSVSDDYYEQNGRFSRIRVYGNSIMPANVYITDFESAHFIRMYEYVPDETEPDGIRLDEYCMDDTMVFIEYEE